MLDTKKKWLALMVLCLGDLMIVLDTTIVNVALPSIRTSLGFSEISLVWVINAYMITYAGFLLLSGRLGDFLGHRRMFNAGIVLFTLASLGCGLAHSQTMLIIARVIQGVGGAIVSAVALSLIMLLFTESAERSKAMGIFGFVMASGGSIGVFLGGFLTDLLSWNWIFLVNIPVGIIVFVMCTKLLPKSETKAMNASSLDIGGATTITASLMLLVYGIVNGNEWGWTSISTLGFLAVGVVLFLWFLWIESRAKSPLVPLRLFKLSNIVTANIVGILWAIGMFAWFFLSALYLQLVLGYSPLKVGLAFLPSNIAMAICSIGISAKLFAKYGVRLPVALGMAFVTLGLVLFARAPISGSFWIDVLPPMLCLGIGGGIALNPLLMAAMGDVTPEESGLASGVVNTAFMMGGSLGLAVLASVSVSTTSHLMASGARLIPALVSGYHFAFWIGAALAAASVVIAWVRFKGGPMIVSGGIH